jgi:plasmid stabilization system protein ParE
MADRQYLYVHWTDRSIANSLTIKNYLQYNFSQREIDNYYELLASFEKIILKFPKLYPKSKKNKKTYRAVLSKQLSVFYTLSKDTVTVIAILDNRMSYSKWP